MTDTTTSEATTAADARPSVDKRACDLAARIMSRMRGHHLLPPGGSEEQDEFEAVHLTAMLREALEG